MSENLMENNKMTIIFFSGTMDKAIAMLILATTAASMGMQVTIFFTFWGLSFLKKGRSYKAKGVMQRMLEFMTGANRNKLPLTELNMLGAGPAMMKKLMTSAKTPSIDELFEMAKGMDVKFVACSTSCGIMGVEKDNLLESTQIGGAASFLEEAQHSKINLFI